MVTHLEAWKAFAAQRVWVSVRNGQQVHCTCVVCVEDEIALLANRIYSCKLEIFKRCHHDRVISMINMVQSPNKVKSFKSRTRLYVT